MKKVWMVLTLLALLLSMTVLGAAAEGEDSLVAETTFAEEVAAFVTAHLPELLSALTLLGTGALTWLFKKSVLTVLEHGLGKIGGGVEDLSKEARTVLDGTREETERLVALAEELIATAETDASSAELLRVAFHEQQQRSEGEIKELRALLLSALAMMKEVFTAARLPAASKLALEEIYRSACSSSAEDAKQG